VNLDSGLGKRGLHFIALDNVSRREGGFGREQIQWLQRDLESSRRDAKFIIVGMHKPFAGNCTGSHSMEEDGKVARAESDEVLGILAGQPGDARAVDAVFVSHDHHFAEFYQDAGSKRIMTYVTGGLGAHLKACTCCDCGAFHHVLQLDVHDSGLDVSVIQWSGKHFMQSPGHDDDDDEQDGELIWDPRCAVGDLGQQGDTMAMDLANDVR
jgi:hypothetical protein